MTTDYVRALHTYYRGCSHLTLCDFNLQRVVKCSNMPFVLQLVPHGVKGWILTSLGDLPMDCGIDAWRQSWDQTDKCLGQNASRLQIASENALDTPHTPEL